jgi:hypothetical protein
MAVVRRGEGTSRWSIRYKKAVKEARGSGVRTPREIEARAKQIARKLAKEQAEAQALAEQVATNSG